jgi:multiple sugar transport system permease protein
MTTATIETSPVSAIGTVRDTWWRRNQKALAPALFLLPGGLLFLVYVIAPIFQSIWISFLDWDGLGAQRFIGLGNYAELLDDSAFYTSLLNNVLWLLFYMLALPAGLAVALFLNQNVFGIRLIKSLFFFPFVLSQVVVGLIFSWFYAPDFGLFYTLTESLTGDGFAILADPDRATYGIIAAGLWPQIAYCMILYLTGLNSINPEQIEAWMAPRAGPCSGISSCRSCGRQPSSPWSLP